MADRLPAGYVMNREIGASASDPIRAAKLEHLFKHTVSFGLDVTGRTKKIQVATRAKVGGTAGWVVGAANDLPYLATLAASQTGSTLIVPIDGLPIGAILTGFKVNAQIESAGGAVTLDADLRAVTNVAAEPTDASIGTMTQVAVTADTAAAQEKTGLTEVVTSGKSYYLKLTGTTAAVTDIILQHLEVYYNDDPPVATQEVIVFVADKAGTLSDVGAGCDETGSSTSITFDLLKRPATSVLTAPISITHATADRTEQAGSLSVETYASGDVIVAKMNVTTSVGVRGPWLRFTRSEYGD